MSSMHVNKIYFPKIINWTQHGFNATKENEQSLGILITIYFDAFKISNW